MLLSGSDVAMGILKELVNKRVEMNSNPTLGIVRVGAKNNDLAYERNILKKFSETFVSLFNHKFLSMKPDQFSSYLTG